MYPHAQRAQCPWPAQHAHSGLSTACGNNAISPPPRPPVGPRSLPVPFANRARSPADTPRASPQYAHATRTGTACSGDTGTGRECRVGTYTFHKKISILSHPIRADNFDVQAIEFAIGFRAFRAHALAFSQLFQHLPRHAGTMQPLRCRLLAQELCDITNARTAPRYRHLPSAS